jgi:hypothetical protein
LKYQWAAEIKKFSNSTPLVIDGSKTQREEQYEKALNWQTHKIDYIILNYEAVVNDWDIVRKLYFSAIICDEATAIKGFRLLLALQLRTVSPKSCTALCSLLSQVC